MIPHFLEIMLGKEHKTLLLNCYLILLLFFANEALALNFSYDSLNRVTNVNYGNGSVISYTYDSAGNRLTYSAVTNNAVTTSPPATGVSDVTNTVFLDDFSSNSINTNVWITSGDTVIETNETMEVLTSVTDGGGTLTSTPFVIANSGLITISRRVFLHHDDSVYYDGNNHFFTGVFLITVSNVPPFSVSYDDYDYGNSELQPTYGFFITRNGASADGVSDRTDVSPGIPAIWDTWFNETITYDPRSGQLQYFINNALKISFNVGVMPITASPSMSFYFQAYGWYTGHEQLFQNLSVVQTINPAPQFVSQAVANGLMSFDLLGVPGSNCVIEVSSNLYNWTPFSTNLFPASGLISIVDSNSGNNPQQFYAVSLPQFTFLETFQNAPNISNNWYVSEDAGTNVVTYTPGNFLVQSSQVGAGSSITFLSNDSFTGDMDLSVQLDHQGYGRTIIGLWSAASTNWLASAILDTDDTAYLAFDSGAFSTQYEFSSAPYMDQWITLRIKTSGNIVQFFANGVLLETTSFTASGTFQLGLSVGSVPWKSGNNDTSFRLVNGMGTRP
jgi:YD repeat-containing protein